jgi:hypothetical protein
LNVNTPAPSTSAGSFVEIELNLRVIGRTSGSGGEVAFNAAEDVVTRGDGVVPAALDHRALVVAVQVKIESNF